MDTTSPPALVNPRPAAMRALALDALRGIAILLMCWSGRYGYGQLSLPSWMYHAQNPPPTGALNRALPGFTWVDWVFPMFLFSMGVAFPFALSSRLRKGASAVGLMGASFLRMMLLVLFAIYFQHAATVVPPEGWSKPLMLLLGFGLLFPVFARLPESWKPETQILTRVLGVCACVVFLGLMRYPAMKVAGEATTHFSLYRSNIILLVLANMAFFGSAVWLLTRDRPVVRLVATAAIAGLLLLYAAPGSFLRTVLQPNLHPLIGEETIAWLRRWFGTADFKWFYNFDYLKYLMIVIPATLVGDALLAWMKGGEEDIAGSARRALLLSTLPVTLVIVAVHVGLQGRWVWPTLIGSPLLLAIAWLLLQPHTGGRTVRFLTNLVMFGGVALVLGIVLDLVEGGIAKSPGLPYSFSYYFTTLGLSTLALGALTVWIDLFRTARWWGVIIDNGQNPMLAYLGIGCLMEPLVTLSGLAALLTPYVTTPWSAALYGLFKTVVLALLVSAFTRLRIVWRT